MSKTIGYALVNIEMLVPRVIEVAYKKSNLQGSIGHNRETEAIVRLVMD